MAGLKDVLKQQFQMGANLVEMFSSDLSDEEYLFQPTEGGCHLTWILGHLADTQDWAVSQLTGQLRRMSEAWIELFKGGATVFGDASRYPSRAQVEGLFRDTQAATLAALDAFDEARWDDPAPQGVPRDYFPTVGSVWSLLATHTFWHIGQLTVNRRMLGKPAKLLG